MLHSVNVSAADKDSLASINTLVSPLINDRMQVVDLSHIQKHDMPAASALSRPSQEFFLQLKNGDNYNIESITYTPHTGTHMDAPYHVFEDGMSIESIDPTVLIGPATVVRLNVSGNYLITKNDIQDWESANAPIQEGDAVFLDTAQDKLWEDGSDSYIGDGYPTLATGAANYFVGKNVRFVGVEAISPDGVEPNAHKVLLGNGIPVVENLRNLGKIGTSRFYSIGTFPAVEGATGVWVRLLALVPE
ncbi:hypothetical protein B4O83_02085 [Chromohalobacter israelensis]|nr:hypothetical protein B4O83_02085 [Chromohalobacter salexigens]